MRRACSILLLALSVLLGRSARAPAQDAGAQDAAALAEDDATSLLDAGAAAQWDAPFSATTMTPAASAASPAAASEPSAEPKPSASQSDREQKAHRGQQKEKKKKKKKKKNTNGGGSRERHANGMQIATHAEIAGGGMSSYRERRDDFSFVRGAVVIEPTLRVNGLVLALPLAVAHREAIGTSLSETRGAATFEAHYRFARAFRVSAFAGLRAVRRPDWPDLRQPTLDGHLETDRYSYVARRVGGRVTVHPARRHWLRGSYEYRLSDYATDPAFEPIEHPTHLAPFDHEKHLAELDYHYSRPGLRLGAGVDGFIKHNFFWFSRDAHTGFTHAGPRGRPPNPLQTLRRVAPHVDLKLEAFKDQLKLYLRYAHELQHDPFQGYYSFSGPNARVGLGYRPIARLWLYAGAELWWRRYGAGSYREGLGHPVLDSGSRRYDRRVSAELGAELSLSRSLALMLEVSYLMRETNFPDYQPGVFPPTRNYSVDWDYENFGIVAGLKARFQAL